MPHKATQAPVEAPIEAPPGVEDREQLGAIGGQRLSRAEQFARGKAAREQAPLDVQGDWSPIPDRRDPIAVLNEQNATRLEHLVPIRWGRMSATPFTFLRGTAAVMAMDLASQPHSGLTVQLCGDAHLSNFGMFATPERNFVFDVNDFDETLPGPFEWDVKRLAASLVVAARDNGFGDEVAREISSAAITTYCEHMARLAGMPYIDIWYSRVAEEDILTAIKTLDAGKAEAKRVQKTFAKARHKTSLETFPKLAENVQGDYVICDEPPLITHAYSPDTAERVQQVLREYVVSLPDDRRVLALRYRVKDIALKVVGVGSVGTRCWVGLFIGEDERDPIFLQAKEARRSVLSDYLGESDYANMGERVVQGQRLMQAASDLFLGWSHSDFDGIDYYFRQLRDMKMSADIGTMGPQGLAAYARLCAWTLARAHARTGEPAAIAGYVGGGKRFSAAITQFAARYADQTIADHKLLAEAIDEGRIEAVIRV